MNRPLLTFYGDDFTGSTDALEGVASQGMPGVLFMEPPNERLLARFADCQAIGIAGESRSRGPAWMERHLPPVFESLRGMEAPVCQYKVCSTFDSSREFGNIGRALEIGQRVFGNPWVPVVVAAPHLKRHVLFGNLFAAAAGEMYRIDRHPTMMRHPVTPMREADLRLHLGAQTARRIGLVDILALETGTGAKQLREVLAAGPDAVLFDGLLASTVRESARLILEQRPSEPLFCIGSSGLTHALVSCWRNEGLLAAPAPLPAVGGVDRLIVVSGSCSPVTEVQLRRAMQEGYAGIRIDPALPEMESLIAEGLRNLGQGRSVAFYSALGPADFVVAEDQERRGEALGRYLGELALELVRRSGARRVLVAGGDTSSHAVRRLGIEALTFAGLLSPGAPLCRGYSPEPAIDGLELVLKGGQVGPDNFFALVQKGVS